MLPAIVKRRVDHFRSVAANLRATAIENPDKPALAQRFLQAAHALDEASSLLECATFVAKLNHETIVARAEA